MPEQARTSLLSPLLHWLLLGGVVGLAVLFTASKPLATNDYSIYVAMGRQMMAQGALLEHDPFTFTVHGQPFIHASWGYALLCTLAHEVAGYQGIRLLVALSVVATLGGVYVLSRRAGASPRSAAVATLFVWIMLLQNVGPRGQTLIYPLFLVVVALLLRPPRPWLGGLAGLGIGWVWTQLHGSFPIPILYAGAIAAGIAFRDRSLRASAPHAAVAAGITLGTLLGPYGPEIWVYVYQNGEVPRHRAVLEWYAPTLTSFAGLRLYGALLLWTVLLLRRPRALQPSSWVVLLGFAFMAATAVRIIAWFGLATAVPLAFALTPRHARGSPSPPLSPRQRTVLCLLAAGWLALLAHGTPREPALAPDTPVDLAERLAEDAPTGKLFAPMEATSYLAWRFHEPSSDPARPLGTMPWPYFLDMRIWIYSDVVWDEYVSVSAAERGWQERLDSWEISHLLLSHTFHGEGLLPAARSSQDWQLVAEDTSGALFRRAPR